DEVALWHLQRACAQQFFKLRLTSRSVSAHVAQIAAEARLPLARTVTVGIEGTIEWNGMLCTETGLQFAQHRATGEAEVKVKTRHLIAAEIFGVSQAQL